MSAIDALKRKTEAMGWKVAVVPYEVRAAAIAQVSARYSRDELDERLYKQRLKRLLTAVPSDGTLSDSRSGSQELRLLDALAS